MLIFFPTQDIVDFYTKFLEIVLWGDDDTEEGDGDDDNMDMNSEVAELIKARNLKVDTGGQTKRGRKIAGLDTTIKETGTADNKYR
jgi:hypothetical protein